MCAHSVAHPSVSLLISVNPTGWLLLGGWGSGRWTGVPQHRLTNQCRQVDLAKMRLAPGHCWGYTLGNPPTGYLRLDLLETPAGWAFDAIHTLPDGTLKRNLIRLESTTPELGGVRRWFLCPLCRRRCRILYLPRPTEALGCRRCHDLRYESQRLNRYWRLNRRLDRLWERLGGTEETLGGRYWPPRPKGRRRATQRRLREAWSAVNSATWEIGLAGLSRAMGWGSR